MRIEKYFPIIQWVSNYKRAYLKHDLSAGITVGIMLIPQGIAYASIIGLPAVYGLYASLVPLLIYAVFGTSPQMSMGPIAIVSLLTATALKALGDVSMVQYINYAIVLAFLSGGIQFLLGFFQLGFLVNFLSRPVISGFTSASAIIIGVSQFKDLFGISIGRNQGVIDTINNLIQNISDFNWIAFAIGACGLLIIILLRKIKKVIPGQLFAVIIGIAAVLIFKLSSGNFAVEIVKDIPSTIPRIQFPTVNFEMIQRLFPMALTIALMGYIQSIAISKSFENKYKTYKIKPNQELVALGLANVFGSFFRSFPVSGGLARTAVNDQSGAKTPFATVISAVLIMLTLLFLTPLFYYLPTSILASVIIAAILNLIDFKEVLYLWKFDKTDFYLLLTTFLATLFISVEVGILLGVTLSVAMVIYKTTKPHIAILANVPGTDFYRNVERFPSLIPQKEILIYRFDAQLYFANVNYFEENLEQQAKAKGEELELIIIDGESIASIDSTGIQKLNDIVEKYNKRSIEVAFSGMKGPTRDMLEKSDLIHKIGYENCFMSIQNAVDSLENTKKNKQQKGKFEKYIKQTNK